MAEQLSRIAEQMAVKNRRARRIWRIVAAILAAVILFNLLLALLSVVVFQRLPESRQSVIESGSEVILGSP